MLNFSLPSKFLIMAVVASYSSVTVALPTTTTTPEPSADELYSLLVEEEAQTFTVPSTVKAPDLSRSDYSATTMEEIKQKQAEEKARQEAAERERRAKEAQSRLKAMTASTFDVYNAVASTDLPCGNGLCWPLSSYTYNESINGFQTSTRPGHNGFDMLAPAGTPIYAVASGTVITSQESLGGYGNAVVIQSVVNEQAVVMTYGHMTSGSRTVQTGETVQAGDVIGLVGSTGRSTANHLHIEISVNGALANPKTWMEANITP